MNENILFESKLSYKLLWILPLIYSPIIILLMIRCYGDLEDSFFLKPQEIFLDIFLFCLFTLFLFVVYYSIKKTPQIIVSE